MKLNTDDVAHCLNLPVSTIKRWVRQGRIPIQKLSDECLFDHGAIEKWAREHDMAFSPPSGGEPETPQPGAADLLEDLNVVMQRGGVTYQVGGETPREVICNAVSQIAAIPEPERETLCAALMEREELTSTGIGKGIAIPHPRTPSDRWFKRPAVITSFLASPVDYGAVDGQSVFVLFLLLSPTPKQHLHILSRLSFCVRDDGFVAFLRSCPEPQALLSRVAAFEAQLARKGM